MSHQPILEVRQLSFVHIGRSRPTIAGVNLALYPGEIVLIAGATGSGKSTLLNCIAGISPTHTGGKLGGEIVYEDTEIREQSVQERSHYLGTLLQNVETQIFTDTVFDELAFGLENLNVPPEQIALRCEASLREFGLEEQRHWAIRQLSAGQKQRLVLACILAMGQSILLLDEPLAYLDARGTEFLLQLLKSRVQQGQSVFLIEHRLDLVREICDRAYHFQEGKLVEGFPSQELWRGEAVPKLSSPDPDAPVVVRSQNLSWGGYPPFPNLEVRAGETVLLKGDNGCGKTTLLRLLSGLLKPATGSLQVFGQDTRNKSVIQMARHIGFVLQNPNHQLFADSVGAEVLQPAVTPEDADALLEKLNLRDRAEQHPQSLSQGQKRRLALGAVLARQPKICLLDEITVGQDPRSLILMLKVLGEFTEGGGTLILTSHDPKVADYLSARIVEIPANF